MADMDYFDTIFGKAMEVDSLRLFQRSRGASGVNLLGQTPLLLPAHLTLTRENQS